MAVSESGAMQVIRGYQPFLVPGLPYKPQRDARRILSLAGVTHPRRLERSVAARMERHCRILADGQKRFIFLLNELALATRIGTNPERDQQVKGLLELVERPNLQEHWIDSGIASSSGTAASVVLCLQDEDAASTSNFRHGDLWLFPPPTPHPLYLAIFKRLAAVAALGCGPVAAAARTNSPSPSRPKDCHLIPIDIFPKRK